MGRFLQYLIFAASFFCAHSVFAAAYWRTTQTADPNYPTFSTALDQEASRHCSYNPSLVNNYTETRGTLTANSSGYQQGMTVHGTYISNGANLNGSCTLFANLNCSSPNVKVNGTPPSCTCPSGTTWNATNGICAAPCASPNVVKPDGACGAPCITGDPLQLKGKSTLSLGKPDSSVCRGYCKYLLTQESPDPDAQTVTVLGTNVGGSQEYKWTALYKGNAQSCSMTSNPDAPTVDPNPEFLQDTATGNTAQWPNHGPCGYVNGTYKCKGVSPSGTCGKTADGGGQCESPKGTPPATPPAPDTGTAGTPAAPVATVTNNTSTTTYYNSSTVNNSTTGMGTVSTPVSGTGGAPSATEMPGSTQNPATVDCHASGTCTDANNSGDTSTPTDAKEFGQSLTDFQTAIAASPVVAAFANVGNAIPSGGTPPSASFEMFGRNYTLAVPTQISSAVTDVLSLIMKAVWSLIAIRRFMSA